MSTFDYEAAKTDIARIIDIVKTVPENLQQRCFELLFDAAFSTKGKLKPPKEATEESFDDSNKSKSDAIPEAKKIPGNVLGFMRRNGITPGELGKLFMLEHEPLLPVYKLPSGNMAKAQLMKVLMLLLENGLLSNSLSAPYAELRTTLKEEGLYDSNFNKTLKKNYTLFKGAISNDAIDESSTVELTGSGMEKLAEAIKELGQ